MRASAESGVAAAMAMASRELATSRAIAAMAMEDGYGGRLAAAQTADLGTALARATAVGGSKQGKSVAVRSSAWRALVCQRLSSGCRFDGASVEDVYCC